MSGTTQTGTAAIEGRLWSVRADDWAATQERQVAPAYEAALDALKYCAPYAANWTDWTPGGAMAIELLEKEPIDVALVGIGENGHLAFNDPPANFDTEEPYLVVMLDEACRRQQLDEGWFENLSDVPRQAISMGIRQILKAHEIIGVVPDSAYYCAVTLTVVA